MTDRLREAWEAPVLGAVLKIVAVLVLLPLAIRALPGADPPLGVYLNGAIIGSLYGLVAVGLILIYRANRIINFAQASIGAAPAVLAILLVVQRGMSYWWAVPMVVLGSVLVGALVEIVFIRRFTKAPRLILTLATIGIAQFLGFFEVVMPQWVCGIRKARVDF